MKKLYIAILYHQHQPMYKDPVKNFYYLPWVRLHTIKDYYDMLTWVERIPKLKLNFNFVPSLLVQIEDYAKGAMDKHLELTLKDVQYLTEEDKLYILKEFFNCNWHNMLYPYKRYKELLELRGHNMSEEELYRKIKYFRNNDWLDLKMWSNLVWFDPYWRETDKEIKQFFEKERNFTQEDIIKMVEKQRWICGQLINKLKQLQDEKKIEITFTPFYHPILPILCDPEKAKVSNPYISLPNNWIPLKEDAEMQLRLGKQYYEKLFGISPKGVWPAEGSVSEDIIPLLCNNDIKWFATDEEILMKSLYLYNQTLSRNKIYQHYQLKSFGNKPIYVIFRDAEISNNIGFVYYKWNYKDAVKDIEKKLTFIYEEVYNKEKYNTAIVPIILDGENCWEFYPNDGTEFLYEFYHMLTTNELFETVLISDYICTNPNAEMLPKLWPGSWIGANFNIWIGHFEDNTAWEYLYKTRGFLVNYINQNKEKAASLEEKINLCWEEIYIAEGSDWYWWFGDEHYTPQSNVFDSLFRQHLKNVYLILGEQPPSCLDIPIKVSNRKLEFVMPSNFISPKIDGINSSYYEWLFAGKYIPVDSAMHQTTRILKSLYFGFDLENFYFRLDYNEIEQANINICFYFIINGKKDYQLQFDLKKYNREYTFIKDNIQQKFEYLYIDKIIELKLPLSLIEVVAQDEIKFFISVDKVDNFTFNKIQRLPEDGFIVLNCPDHTYFKKFWVV